jgi:hypothetical protein
MGQVWDSCQPVKDVSTKAEDTVEIHYQAMTSEDKAYWKDSMCYSELLSVLIKISIIITHS